MVKFKEYRVVSEVGFVKFQNRVNDLIQQGWEPLGGVSYTDGDFYCKAMGLR